MSGRFGGRGGYEDGGWGDQITWRKDLSDNIPPYYHSFRIPLRAFCQWKKLISSPIVVIPNSCDMSLAEVRKSCSVYPKVLNPSLPFLVFRIHFGCPVGEGALLSKWEVWATRFTWMRYLIPLDGKELYFMNLSENIFFDMRTFKGWSKNDIKNKSLSRKIDAQQITKNDISKPETKRVFMIINS